MRRAAALLAVLVLPVAGSAQAPGVRLHLNLPASYPFEALPRGVVVAPQTAAGIERASGAGAWSEAQRPPDEILRPRDAWDAPTRELDPNTRSPAGTSLRYREVFTPSVSPFKRTQSFDAVDARGRLFVRDPVLRPLRVGASRVAPGEAAQRFTGDVFVEVSPDSPTPLPSVSAEPNVLAYRTSPEVPVAFFHDSAGNLYARGERTATVRLTYVLEAPERSFVPRAIPSVPVGEVAQRLGVRAPTVPAFLAGDAPAVLAHYGVRADSGLSYALERLTARLRAFRDADLPAAPSGSLYRALATGGVGACRHRAYAFALTMHALGVPARYVGNEAHAWVEVQLPDNGWTRIDLGGWDVPLTEESPNHREAFVPQQPDPFPRPAEYVNGYSTRDAHRGATRRIARDAAHDAGAPEALPAAQDPDGDPTQATGAGTAASGASGASDPGGVQTAPGEVGGAQRERARVERPADDAETARRVRTTLRLQEVSSDGGGEGRGFVRGTLLRCVGDARDEDEHPVADLPIQIELLRDGTAVAVERGGRRGTALGTTVTDPEGRFEARVLLPYELGAGSYELRVRTPGDARHLPARSE